MKLSTILSAAALSATAAAAENTTIEIVGNKFFYSNNGSQFYIKGIAYQANPNTDSGDASYVDPLADGDACARDLPYLLQLNTNVLRVYAINASADHSTCMNMFADAGIFIINDLSEPDLAIDRSDPSWDLDLYDRYTSVIDAMQGYSNVLGFFAGNEVTNAANNTDADAYVKAAVRDMKAYISDSGYRSIPIGYSASDAASIRVPEAEYFNCGDSADKVDFYGINMYEWCGESTYASSGYKNATDNFKDLGIPLFFSEYGCNAVQPRKFEEVGTLYGSDMTGVWSGGIVYMYFEEANNYGLVTVSGSSVSTLEDFGYLSSELATISPSIATSSDVTTTASVACPSTGVDWSAATNLPPTPDRGLCECVDAAAACVVDSSVSSDDYGDLFSYLCGSAGLDCSGVNGNATTGEYGAYSGCDSKAKLNYLLNLYYESNGAVSSNCDFSGSATVVSPSTASSCKAALSQAGTDGTGSVSGTVSATGSATNRDAASASGSASGSSSGSSDKSSSKSGSSNAAATNIQLCGTMLGSVALVFLSIL